MFPNYLYRRQQAPLAPRWSKPRRGLLITIWFSNGVTWGLYECQGRHYYQQVGGFQAVQS